MQGTFSYNVMQTFHSLDLGSGWQVAGLVTFQIETLVAQFILNIFMRGQHVTFHTSIHLDIEFEVVRLTLSKIVNSQLYPCQPEER